jgi:hypothetical protein
MVSGRHQFDDLHFSCFHFLQAADAAREVFVGTLSAFLVALFAEMYGFPLAILSALWLAAERLPEGELVRSRRRPPAGDAVRLEGESAFRPPSTS